MIQGQICTVTDGSKASPWIVAPLKSYSPCTCTGAAKECSTLNVCDVAKKTCTCTPGKDHFCYVDKERIYAVKYDCFKKDDTEFRMYKCDGDNLLRTSYSDDKCTTVMTVANGGKINKLTPTSETTTKKDDENGGVEKTETSTDTVGISTCKGGVAGPSEAEKKKRVGASPSPSSTGEKIGDNNAASLTLSFAAFFVLAVTSAISYS